MSFLGKESAGFSYELEDLQKLHNAMCEIVYGGGSLGRGAPNYGDWNTYGLDDWEVNVVLSGSWTRDDFRPAPWEFFQLFLAHFRYHSNSDVSGWIVDRLSDYSAARMVSRARACVHTRGMRF